MKIKNFKICDETMHVQVVEGEALSILSSKTGTWRSVRPVPVEGKAPCADACPGNIRTVEYLALLGEGKIDEALVHLMEDNPMASITGRVCPGFCETQCNRGEFDEPIAIRELERTLGDIGLTKGFYQPATAEERERVAIIGSGPAGLSAAYYLACHGYRVTIFEATPRAGGMLAWGIPEHRLPRKIVDKVIASIKGLGIEIKTNVAVGRDLSFEDLMGEGYGAVLISVGAWKDLRLNIPGEDAEGVFPGVRFLHTQAGGTPWQAATVPGGGEKGKFQDSHGQVGERVCVVGGGNTAIDSARVAARLGAGRVEILYRRSREEMPAISEEVEAALEEGIEIQFLVAPVEILVEKGKVRGLRCMRMELGDPDDTGRRRPLPIADSMFDVEADMAILAIGQSPDLSFLDGSGIELTREGRIHSTNESLATNLPNVFVAGDAASGPATVIQAIAGGKKAASEIGAFLRGSITEAVPKSERVVRYEDLNTNYFKHEARQGFESNDSEALKKAAVTEALRCFQCGRCTACNTCWFLCPDGVILPEKTDIKIDYDYCKGCGICVEECPRAALIIEEENKWQ